MSVNTIAARYAKTLIELAVDQKSLNGVLEDVKGFQKATEQRDFYLLLKSPIVNTEKKITILKEIFDGKITPITMSFLTLMTKKGREMYLPEISSEFVKLYNERMSISKVLITTSKALSDAELASIKAKLTESTATMNNLEIETRVDPSIIGGFVIEIGDRLYDASVSHKLDELKKQFSGSYELAN